MKEDVEMKVAVIVHSHTGNTLSVGEKIVQTLVSSGNDAVLKRVIAVDERPEASKNVILKECPAIQDEDLLIFGAPVRGFALSPVMKKYFSSLETLSGKAVECFATEFFPFAWMGGNKAIKTMKDICEEKGATIKETSVVNWSRKDREKKIEETVTKLCSL